MGRLILYLALLLGSSLLFYGYAQDSAVPLQVLPSKDTYGPDGPWQAVTVELGTPPQSLDLLPGGVYSSNILTKQVCDGISAKPCGSGGLFDISKSSSLDDTSITVGNIATDDLLIPSTSSSSSGTTISNLSAAMTTEQNITLPDGTIYPPQLGDLSLGSHNANQTFTEGDGIPAINASLIPGFLNASKIIPSSSFGLHIGSAALKLPLSLWFGGYDAARVLGTVSSRPYGQGPSSQFDIDLFDIGIEVDNGGSPFSYQSKFGLLASGNSSIVTSIPVAVDPTNPYMALPNSTCAAITKELPVTYNSQYGLYFWNTQDPQYTKIVTSPSYLSFVFDTNMTINVPFKLLNLTLVEPIISTPTQYFPCQPPADPSKGYYLGRAFLQAAFMGVNWGEGNGQWFLAQAPGPGIGSVPQQLPITGNTIPSTTNDWSATWKGFWTPIAATSAQPNAPAVTTSSPKHLSAGADAGIAVGSVAVVLIALAIGFFLFRRRKARTPSLNALLPAPMYDKPIENKQNDFYAPGEGGPPQYATAELPSTQMRRSELSGAEMYEMQQPSRRGTAE